MKTVLLVSQDFPPQSMTSVNRTLGMARYLNEYGWSPIVLTQEWTSTNCVMDESLLDAIPSDVPVYRVSIPTERSRISTLADLGRRVIAPHLFPGRFTSGAMKIVRGILAETTIDAVWGTAPMMCNHTIAAAAAGHLWVPWVADFRDVHQFGFGRLGAFGRQLRISQEKRIVKTARALTTVSETFARALEKRHARAVSVVPNGFDPFWTRSAAPATIDQRSFRIVYTGGANLGGPTFRPLLDAIGRLSEEKQNELPNISLHFYGAWNEKALEAMFQGHPLRRIVHNHGYLQRAKLVEEQRKATVLLQAGYPGTGTLTSKIYEYLAAQRPILAIPGDQGEIDNLLTETAAGVHCSTVCEIAAAIRAWYSEWLSTGSVQWRGDSSAVAKYSRRRQAGQLQEILDAITQPG